MNPYMSHFPHLVNALNDCTVLAKIISITLIGRAYFLFPVSLPIRVKSHALIRNPSPGRLEVHAATNDAKLGGIAESLVSPPLRNRFQLIVFIGVENLVSEWFYFSRFSFCSNSTNQPMNLAFPTTPGPRRKVQSPTSWYEHGSMSP